MVPFDFSRARAAYAAVTRDMDGFNPVALVPVRVDLSSIDGQYAWDWARHWTCSRTRHGRADLARPKEGIYAMASFESVTDATEFKLSMPPKWH